MQKFIGLGVSEGVAVAKSLFLDNCRLSVEKNTNLTSAEEKERYERAKKTALDQLDRLIKQNSGEKQTSEILEVHKMLITDDDFVDEIRLLIDGGCSAEYAVKTVSDDYALSLSRIDNEYMRERSADVNDICTRLLRILLNLPELNLNLTQDTIIVAVDLLPSQIVKLDKSKIVGFVTQVGSVTSHAVILARLNGLPCVVGVNEGFDQIASGEILAIDGNSGEIFVAPDERIRAKFAELGKEQLFAKNQLVEFRNKTAVSKSGKKVRVVANIGSVQDVKSVIENDGDGVGLFRSEFLYLEGDSFPSEQKQFEAYKQVLSQLNPKQVVIRTLDLGSDKQASYFDIGQEANPALGYRAIRICLAQQDIFVTQLRALMRASAFGNLAVMFPMITHLEQVKQIKQIIKRVQIDLDGENIKYGHIEWGIMVETPSAALISDKLAKEVDFFSIGTNDLTQYTLAADRTNSRISNLFDSAHESVLRLIEMTAINAHKNGICVGICGESASRADLIDFYLSVGIDELSVSPPMILKVKKAIIESDK